MSGVRALLGEYLSRVPMQSEAVAAVHGCLAALPPGRWLLAVSGGRDSMVLLDAMATARAQEIAGIATFDHGTGPAATRAVSLVERTAMALSIPVISGRDAGPAAAMGEAAWRAARWRFLRGWAEELRATVVTAHSRDDQIETVLQRLLRDAGPRGLAAMRALPDRGDPAAVVRPLLGVPREMLATYATARRLRFIEDPSNASLRFQRNRVRLELLPALERAVPGFGDWTLSLAARAAAWRDAVAAWVDASLAPVSPQPGTLTVSAARSAQLTVAEWGIVWPELAARVGVVMDRRGIARASAWAPHAKAGGEIPLAAGARIVRSARSFAIRAPQPPHRHYIEDSELAVDQVQ